MKRIIITGSLLATILWGAPKSDIVFKQQLLKIGVSKKVKENPSKNKINKIASVAKKYLGTRYKYGASTKTTKKFDCSSFTKHVIKKARGKNLPRTARAQARVGKHISKKNLRAGDLVFFKNTDRRKTISHVGIMISTTEFIHASSGARKVTISRINKAYYRKHYVGARRV